MRYRLRTLVIATAIGPPVLTWVLVNTEIALIVGMFSPLFALLVVPIWAGIRRGNLQEERRLRRERRGLASNP